MAWSDVPSSAQLDLLYKWFSWQMPTPKARDAIKWLGDHADKRSVSDEIKRVGDLYRHLRLNEELCFSSPIWDGYSYTEEGQGEN